MTKRSESVVSEAGQIVTPAHPTLSDHVFNPEDLADPALFLNREHTWMNFNWRVLYQARREELPLLERLKFVAIASSNLDEFFMKRIGGLKQQLGAGVDALSVDGRSPGQQLHECAEGVRTFVLEQVNALNMVLAELAKHGVELTAYQKLTDPEREHLRDYYLKNIFPLVTPQAVDPAHPFPFVSNLSLNLLVSLLYSRGESQISLARVKVPVSSSIPRFLSVGGGLRFVSLEDVMANNLDLLFPGMVVERVDFFRVTRNAVTEQDEEQAEDLLAMIESELRERKFAEIVRVQVNSDMPEEVRQRLAAELALSSKEEDVYTGSSLIGGRDLMQIASLDIAALRHASHHPVTAADFVEDRSIFHIIRDKKAILVHHPYEAFSSSVERFLGEAAADPKVMAIKMTLYRTSKRSRVIQHLIEAARNGKQVAVVLELKARFDEAANLRWAERLEQVGIHVTYGVVGLKTHSKVTLVVRDDYDGLRRYAHVGTGNYHSVTARIYSDYGLFTSDEQLGADLTELFNYLTTGFKPGRKYKKVLPAPKHLKAALLAKIDREAKKHTKENPGHIQMKMNALEDPDVVSALYQAGKAGVHVDLIVRDSCRLRPGVRGLTKNVRVVSIVGRFLEHTRLYYFKNGGREEYYIGSADAMRRNLESRVEVLVPVADKLLRSELRRMLNRQLADRWNAWEMQPDGSYVMLHDDEATCSHTWAIEHAEKKHKAAVKLGRRKTVGVPRKLKLEP